MLRARNRVGALVSEAGKKAIERSLRYPNPEFAGNPLIRKLARNLVHAEWRKRLNEIDFPYTDEFVKIAGIPSARLTAEPRKDAKHSDKVVLHLHGGAFIAGSPWINAACVLPTLHLTGANCFSVDYSLSPEEKFPRALDEIDLVYQGVINAGRDPRSVVLFGDSAGANLALASMIRWRDRGVPLPGGAVLLSPTTDATSGSDTTLTQTSVDPIVSGLGKAGFAAIYDLYAQGEDVLNPLISPAFADITGLPPLLIQVGSREVLLGDSARLAEKARRSGVEASLQVFDGMFHLFQMHWSMPEAKYAHEDIASFIGQLD